MSLNKSRLPITRRFPGLLIKQSVKAFPGGHKSLGGMMFQKVDAMAEKACLLGSISWNSLIDEACNMQFLPDLMGHIDVIGERQFLR